MPVRRCHRHRPILRSTLPCQDRKAGIRSQSCCGHLLFIKTHRISSAHGRSTLGRGASASSASYKENLLSASFVSDRRHPKLDPVAGEFKSGYPPVSKHGLALMIRSHVHFLLFVLFFRTPPCRPTVIGGRCLPADMSAADSLGNRPAERGRRLRVGRPGTICPTAMPAGRRMTWDAEGPDSQTHLPRSPPASIKYHSRKDLSWKKSCELSFFEESPHFSLSRFFC